jgi:hypothetical protein
LLNDSSVGSVNPIVLNMTGNFNLTAVFNVNTVFADGFESGSFSSWTDNVTTAGETASVVSALPHHGIYGAYFSSNGNGTAESAYCYKTISPLSEAYARGYFYVSQSGINVTDSRFYLIVLRAGSTKVAFAGWRQTGGVVKWTLSILDGTGGVIVYSASSPVLNRWYCVELHWKGDSTNGLGELWVDGVLVCSASGKNTAYYGNVSRVDFGLAELRACNSTSVYGDCFKVSKLYNGPEPPSSIYLQFREVLFPLSRQRREPRDLGENREELIRLKELLNVGVAVLAGG